MIGHPLVQKCMKYINENSYCYWLLVSDFANQFEECLQTLGQWIAEGKIKYKVDVVEGIENAPMQ